MTVNAVGDLFTRVLEAHSDPDKVTVTHSQWDRMLPVQTSNFDEHFFREMAAVLSPDQVLRSSFRVHPVIAYARNR